MLFCFTLTENIRCMLPFDSNFYCWNYLFVVSAWHLAECTGSVFVKSTQTRMVPTGSMWVNSFVVLSFSYYYYHVFCSHREVWNVQYRILQSMQAKNCGTLFSVYGICKCTGRNYLYFSNVISLIWGKTVLQLPESHKQCKWEFDFYFLFHITCLAPSCQTSMDLKSDYRWEEGSKLTTFGLLYRC